MWIVKNLLRGTLSFRGLGVSIPPDAEFDLDTLGREAAEGSNQLIVAFEEGYLQNVHKDKAAGSAQASFDKGITAEDLDKRLASYKKEFVEEFRDLLTNLGAKEDFAQLQDGIVGSMKDMFENLKEARIRIVEEKERIRMDRSLSKTEMRARMAFLEQQERELSSNFSKLGRQSTSEGGDDILDKADLLSNI